MEKEPYELDDTTEAFKEAERNYNLNANNLSEEKNTMEEKIKSEEKEEIAEKGKAVKNKKIAETINLSIAIGVAVLFCFGSFMFFLQ